MLHKLFLTTIVVFLDPGSPEQLLIAIIEIVIICGVVGIASPHCSKAETIMCVCVHLQASGKRCMRACVCVRAFWWAGVWVGVCCCFGARGG
jgi:hypothetical protein